MNFRAISFFSFFATQMSVIDFDMTSPNVIERWSPDSPISSESSCSDDHSEIPKMSSIHPLCNAIGGVYNVQTANVMLMCDDDNNTALVPAHKSILAADSSVFYQQFYVKSPDNNKFRIANTTGDVLCKFLTSFYAKSMKVHRDDVAELMQLAYDFDALKCKQICHQFLMKSLDTGVDDVLWILEMALMHKCQAVCDRCIEKVHQCGDFLIQTAGFLECNRRVIQMVVGDEFLGRNEKRLLGACIEWARRRIGSKTAILYEEIRREMGQCFEMIHFDMMDANEFVECLGEFGPIFRSDEICDISKAISVQRRQSPSHIDLNVTKEHRCVVPRGRLHTMQHIFERRPADFRKLYNDNASADMYFVFVTTAVRIAAHKCILATKSPIFQQRLFEVTGPVEVLENTATPRTFSAFLKLLYGYEINEVVTKTNLDAILTLANEYQVLDICKGQEIQLKQFATLETLFWAVDLCTEYGFVDSMHFDCKWIEKHAHKFDLNLAFHPTALVRCSRATVQNALGIVYPNRSALRILVAVMNWAKHRCQQAHTNSTATIINLRKTLKGILMMVPFHEMTRTLFETCQNSLPGLLDDVEVQEILAKIEGR